MPVPHRFTNVFLQRQGVDRDQLFQFPCELDHMIKNPEALFLRTH